MDATPQVQVALDFAYPEGLRLRNPRRSALRGLLVLPADNGAVSPRAAPAQPARPPDPSAPADPTRRICCARADHTRRIYTRYTLLGLSSVDTLKQQWTGEIFVEFLSVLEDSREALQHVIGRALPAAIAKPADLLPRGSITSFPFKTEQHQAHQRHSSSNQALRGARNDASPVTSPLSPGLPPPAAAPALAAPPALSMTSSAKDPLAAVEEAEEESVGIVRDLFPLKINNLVEEKEAEHWVKKHSLLDLDGLPASVAVAGLRPWKLIVQTSRPPPTLESLRVRAAPDDAAAAAAGSAGGAGALPLPQDRGAGSEGGSSGAAAAAAGPANAKAFRAATVGELLLEAAWRYEQQEGELGQGESPQSFEVWLGALVSEERVKRIEVARSAGDEYLREEHLDSDILNELMKKTLMSAQPERKCELTKELRRVLQGFCVFSYNLRICGAFEHSFELESFPSDAQHPFADFSLKSAVNEYDASLRRCTPEPMRKWGATFCLPREARSHEIEENLWFIKVGSGGEKMAFDCMRVWDFRKSNLESMCV